ncbi:MAG: tRNA epoxyqueuosine(34) reductase QueG [Gemmatimonadota bacterium]
MNLTARLKQRAEHLGFDLVGVTSADPPPHADHYREWLARGYGGEMSYLAREDAVRRRVEPRGVLPNARSVLAVALNYHLDDDGPVDDPARAVFARYARGDDYHAVFEEKLGALAAFLEESGGRAKCYVDYGPVLERDLAQRAGLGWIGKNTVLIHPEIGSYLFLGEIFTDLALEPDPPFTADRCGTCTRCIEACPTGAIRGPRELDARLCISYLTIELHGPIPRELRALIGNRVFGCDICQEVCPWNRYVPETSEERFKPREVPGPELVELMGLTEEAFERRFAGSAITRAKRGGLLRNVAVALGNWGSDEAVPALRRALDDADPLVRGHAAWALGRIGAAEAWGALALRLRVENDDWVQEELAEALSGSQKHHPA